MNNLITLGKQAVHEMTQSQRQGLAAAIIEQAADGNADPLQVLQSIKAWEDVFKQITGSATFSDMVLSEVQKHGRKLSLNGNTLEVAEAGTTYDFSVCNDPVYNNLDNLLADLKANIDNRKEFLKRIPPEGIDFIDIETSEVIKIYPPAKSSKTITKVTLRKS